MSIFLVKHVKNYLLALTVVLSILLVADIDAIISLMHTPLLKSVKTNETYNIAPNNKVNAKTVKITTCSKCKSAGSV